ncbi:MAG: hypothetical protein Q8O27_00930 [Enterobacteriaceae bacterium]|nr:hypothetical protein [Enterobacteriaceae bacterium]
MLNKLDSFCHSINRKIKFELVNMLMHQIAGTIQAKKSPHLPCGLKLVDILGRIFKLLILPVLLKTR